LTQEVVEKAVADAMSKQKAEKGEAESANPKYVVDGKTYEVANGRYGYYLKNGRTFISLPKEHKKDISGLTQEIVENAVRSKKE